MDKMGPSMVLMVEDHDEVDGEPITASETDCWFVQEVSDC